MEFKIILPMPPSLNSVYRIGKGNWYTSAETKKYSETVRLLVFKSGQPRFSEDDRLRVDVYLYFADKRKHDIDNPLKKLLDSLEDAKVFPNDSQIDQLYIERCFIKKPAHVFVVIRKIV